MIGEGRGQVASQDVHGAVDCLYGVHEIVLWKVGKLKMRRKARFVK